MTRVGVDTNVVVSFLTERNAEQQARAAQLMDQAARRDLDVVLHQVVVTEAVYVLVNLYGLPPGAVSRAVAGLLAHPGVHTFDELPWPAVWKLWPRRVPDFADACLSSAARHGAFDMLATFDRRFAGLARKLGVEVWRAS